MRAPTLHSQVMDSRRWAYNTYSMVHASIHMSVPMKRWGTSNDNTWTQTDTAYSLQCTYMYMYMYIAAWYQNNTFHTILLEHATHVNNACSLAPDTVHTSVCMCTAHPQTSL